MILPFASFKFWTFFFFFFFFLLFKHLRTVLFVYCLWFGVFFFPKSGLEIQYVSQEMGWILDGSSIKKKRSYLMHKAPTFPGSGRLIYSRLIFICISSFLMISTWFTFNYISLRISHTWDAVSRTRYLYWTKYRWRVQQPNTGNNVVPWQCW